MDHARPYFFSVCTEREGGVKHLHAQSPQTLGQPICCLQHDSVSAFKKRTMPSASTAAQKIAQPARLGEKFPKIRSSQKRETKTNRGVHLPHRTVHQEETDALTQVVCSKKKRKTTQLGSSPGFLGGRATWGPSVRPQLDVQSLP